LIQSRNKPLTPQQLKGIREQKSLMLESMRGLTGKKGDTGGEGLRGDKGIDGNHGVDGLQGDIGDTGPRGPRGYKGETGAKGQAIKGDTGEDGQDGRGIVRLQIHGFNLLVTYTDGEKVNLGRVVGQPGQPGQRGRSGFGFGDTTNNTTNITEEVLSPEDSENLAAISPAIQQLIENQEDQLKEVQLELKLIKTHLSLMTDEELKETDIEEL